MRIKNVVVKNYKSLKDVTVGSLKTINMLYGYNNTGKSNFLRFIDLVFCRKERLGSVEYAEDESILKEELSAELLDWWDGTFKHKAFMFTDDNRELAVTFVVLMDVAHIELGKLQKKLATDFLDKTHHIAHICFEGTIRSVTYDDSEISLTRVTINKKTAFDSSAGESSRRYFPESKALLGQAETLNSLLAIFNDCVLFLGSDRYLTEEREVSNVSGDLNAQNAKNWLFEYYMNSQKHAKFMDFIAFVKAYRCKHTQEEAAKSAWRQWPFSTGDVGFGRFGQSIDLMLRNAKDRFPLSSYGTGVQQILYLLARLFFTPASIVLIEEIELNLSPTAQRELLINLKRLLSDKGLNQVLFTTHSNYFASRADFQIYEAVLDKAGYTSINRKPAAGRDFFRRTFIN